MLEKGLGYTCWDWPEYQLLETNEIQEKLKNLMLHLMKRIVM